MSPMVVGDDDQSRPHRVLTLGMSSEVEVVSLGPRRRQISRREPLSQSARRSLTTPDRHQTRDACSWELDKQDHESRARLVGTTRA